MFHLIYWHLGVFLTFELLSTYERILSSAFNVIFALTGDFPNKQCKVVGNCSTCKLVCSCFSSPIRRARSTTEIIWQGQGRDGPCIFLDSLKEAHLGWMEGMKQGSSKSQQDWHSMFALLTVVGHTSLQHALTSACWSLCVLCTVPGLARAGVAWYMPYTP